MTRQILRQYGLRLTKVMQLKKNSAVLGLRLLILGFYLIDFLDSNFEKYQKPTMVFATPLTIVNEIN